MTKMCGKNIAESATKSAPKSADEAGFDFSKRSFLSGATAAAGVALASGVMLYGVGAKSASAHVAHGADASKRWGMLIDVNKCDAGCEVCVHACEEENGLTGFDRPETDAQWIRKVNLVDLATGNKQSLPVMCQHCEDPPCVDVCPTGASFKRADGIVLVDKHSCIGCRYCIMACPYKARSFVHEDLTDQKSHAPRGKGTVEGCTMCVHRIDDDRLPACVEACGEKAGGAMMFGDLNDATSEISIRVSSYATSQIRPDLKLNTGVRYQNL